MCWIVTVSDLQKHGKNSKNSKFTNETKQYYLTAGRHQVGRKGPALKITVSDSGVSRLQGILEVSADYDVYNLDVTPTLTWTNVGKFPSKVNETEINSHKPVVLQEGFSIKIGKGTKLLAARWKERFVFCGSRISKSKDLPKYLSLCKSVGAIYQSKWNEFCTHLVTPSGCLSASPTILSALVCGANIVNLNYLQEVFDFIEATKSITGPPFKPLVLPKPEKFIPEARDNAGGQFVSNFLVCDPIKLKRYARRRRNMFKGLVFGFQSLTEACIDAVKLAQGDIVIMNRKKRGTMAQQTNNLSMPRMFQVLCGWDKQKVQYAVISSAEQGSKLKRYIRTRASKGDILQNIKIINDETISLAIISADKSRLDASDVPVSRTRSINAQTSAISTNSQKTRSFEPSSFSGSVSPHHQHYLDEHETTDVAGGSEHSKLASKQVDLQGSIRRQNYSRQRRQRRKLNSVEPRGDREENANNVDSQAQTLNIEVERAPSGKWTSVAVNQIQHTDDSDEEENDCEQEGEHIVDSLNRQHNSVNAPIGKAHRAGGITFFRKNNVLPPPQAYIHDVNDHDQDPENDAFDAETSRHELSQKAKRVHRQSNHHQTVAGRKRKNETKTIFEENDDHNARTPQIPRRRGSRQKRARRAPTQQKHVHESDSESDYD